MISTRKRKQIITKLNAFFEQKGKILTQEEYMKQPEVPYRIGIIRKYLRGWPQMVNFLTSYYPKWKEETKTVVKEVPVKEEPAVDPLEALRRVDFESENE
jgi:hypothetical protein